MRRGDIIAFVLGYFGGLAGCLFGLALPAVKFWIAFHELGGQTVTQEMIEPWAQVALVGSLVFAIPVGVWAARNWEAILYAMPSDGKELLAFVVGLFAGFFLLLKIVVVPVIEFLVALYGVGQQAVSEDTIQHWGNVGSLLAGMVSLLFALAVVAVVRNGEEILLAMLDRFFGGALRSTRRHYPRRRR